MSLFKKKYKRSEWFEGLLWAESIVSTCGIDHLRMYIYLGAHDPYEFESDRGAEDFHGYYESILDQLENK